MKCISCGGEIGLTDKVCPYCGRVLTETAGHRADMSYYKEDSAKTKKKVKEIIAENMSVVISAAVLILLLFANIGVFYVKENAFLFRENAVRRESVKQAEEYRAAIQDYLDAGDYTGFVTFKAFHNIAEWEAPYDDLRLFWEIASEYSNLVSAVEESTMFGPEARKYDSASDDAEDCNYAIRHFYQEFESRISEIDADPYRDYFYDMKDQADIILEIYLGMDETGREEYFTASEIRQKAYLEEVLQRYEKYEK